MKSQKQDHQMLKDLIATLTVVQRTKNSFRKSICSSLLSVMPHNKFRRSVPPANSLGQPREFPEEYTRGIITYGIPGITRGIIISGSIVKTFEVTEIGPLHVERSIACEDCYRL